MKKFLFFFSLFFLIINSINATEKFIGKWANDNTNSIFEIKKNGKIFDMYLLYSGRFFKKYKNKLIGSFEKKNIGYKGSFVTILNDYPWTEIDSKSSYKIKDNKLILTVKGNHNGNKFKFKSYYTKVLNDIKYPYGEELFGIQIGKTIDNYNLGSDVMVGDENFKVKQTIIYPPNPNDDFGAYLIDYSKTTKQIYEIDAYLKINNQNLRYRECKNAIQPYQNYINDKYSSEYTIGSGRILSTVLKKSGREIYSIFADCEEREGYWVGFISLSHLDLRMIDSKADYDLQNNTKKKF